MRKFMSVLQADITALNVDAIVNAANRSLLGGGGGVDGAIHRAAGPDLLAECLLLDGCETGEAKITEGYQLPAKYVIHTVGPVWQGGQHNEAALLAACYQNCLQLAMQYSVKSVAFPSISTGVYRFPKRQAAEIAITTVNDYLSAHQSGIQVVFCCFSAEDERVYQSVLARYDLMDRG